jgi:cobalt/nickel transport system permease protein
MLLLHIGAFCLDVDSQRSTLWHRLAPQTRVLCAILLVFAIALTPNGRWWTWAIYGGGVAIAIFISRVTLTVLLRRIIVEFAFVGVILIGTLFRQGGTLLWQWGVVQITSVGLITLASVALKTLLSLTILNVLTLTTPIPALLQALEKLKVPPLLVAIFASMYRYLNVLIDEFNAMRRAAAARNLTGNNHWQRMVIGNMIGALFIRTYERGDRIHQAMLSRGYTGLPPVTTMPKRGILDLWALSATITLLLAGQVVYLRD